MRQITVIVHHENGSWWAESEDLPGFSALGSDLVSLRSELAAGVSFYLDDAPFRIIERDVTGAALTAASVYSPPSPRWWTASEGRLAPMANLFSRAAVAHVSPVGMHA